MSKFTDIYKFREMNINSLVLLSSCKLWFASIQDLNDPFEGYVYIAEPSNDDEKIEQYIKFGQNIIEKHNALSSEKAREIVLSNYFSDPKSFIKFIDEILGKHPATISRHLSQLGIYSVSSDIPGNSMTQESNMLMWSHYADGFKGFCIHYDLQKLHSSLRAMNPGKKFEWCSVNYLDKPHKINFVESIEKETIEALRSIQSKHSQWRYECEIRILASQTGAFSFSPSAVKTIYVGERMPREQKDLLITLARSSFPECALKEVRVARNLEDFSVSVAEI
ncbi:MAG: DUF2971 domain-containing protein [Pseudohongiellaceae bacterium]|nr:DUF2971 domain-containing protein [Pseudohongiellaceae bacterium]